MSMAKNLIIRADRVLDEYGKIDPNYANIAGFVASLLEVFRHSRNPQLLLKMLNLEHPRPQSRKYWGKFKGIISSHIKDLSARPDYLLKFLAYLKRKAVIRKKSSHKKRTRGSQFRHNYIRR